MFATLPPDTSEKTIRRLLRDAYPFGERSYWPYKAWLARARAWRAAWAIGREPIRAVNRRIPIPLEAETLDLFPE